MDDMYEHLSIVGQRGQITLPKDIRDKEGIRPKDKVIVKIEDDKIVVEKTVKRKDRKTQLIEGYKQMSVLDRSTENDFARACDKEMKTIRKELQKTNALLLSLVPEIRVSRKEMEKLKKIKAEMDSGNATAYSKDLF